jgi:predicted enzyme related to lactoylglutathione lyase
MASMKLQTAMIFAKDMSRMTAFYRDGLGLAIVPDKSMEGWVVFDAGGTLLALHAIPADIARSIAITDPPEPRSETPIKLIFQTPDLDAACANVQRLGGILLQQRRPGARDAADPEGNIFQLVAD